MDDQPFQLGVFQISENTYGLELRQRRLKGDVNADDVMPTTVRIWGTPLTAVLDHVLEVIKKNGFKSSDLRANRKEPFGLEEEHGVRLGLLFMAVKPLHKLGRIDAISRSIWQMETEEAYYWFSKCSRATHRRRACRAVRILTAEE